jgi:hypothetical protein
LAGVVHDPENNPVLACCQISESIFFDAYGPVSQGHIWLRTRMPMRCAYLGEQDLIVMFHISERDLEEAEDALGQLSEILSTRIYQ